MNRVKLLVVPLLVVVVALGATTAARAQSSDDQKVVLTVGIFGNTFDTLNPLVGYTVPDYDVWIPQYDTVTRKAAADFETIPGLAVSWEGSNNGKTYTYKLRNGLKWSDGQPLTAEDVAFTINRSHREEWQNYPYTSHLTAKVIDDRTVEVTSSVPDPKLPGLGDTYILPEHVWGKLSPEEITKYAAEDGVGSGPFTLDEFKRGQYVKLKVNPLYWGGQRPIDEIVFRLFNNADSMLAAVESGEIDAAWNIASQSFNGLESKKGVVAVQGNQGGFEEIAINGGGGLKKPHPALLDKRVRVAIAHAIDKQTLLSSVYADIGTVVETVSPSPDPVWMPEIPKDDQFTYDPELSKKILDGAGYTDTNGDGIREMPGGGSPLEFTYYVRSDSDYAPPVSDFVAGWLKDIGIKLDRKYVDTNQLGPIIGKGDYDMFHWTWTPYVDPDQQLSYFRCNQIAEPADPTLYNNDANWCNAEYDKLYAAQNVELDHAKRVDIVHRMLKIFHDDATYQVFLLSPDLEVYRTDRFTGWTKQPAEIGPVIFTNTTPTYFNLEPTASSGGGGGGVSTTGIAGIAVVALGGIALIVYFVRRRQTAEERE